MKKNYVTIISLLIICAAALIYAMSERDTQQAPQRLHAYINPADLQAITISRGEHTIELVPRGTAWYIQDRDFLIMAEADAMLNLLEFINTSSIIQLVTKKTETYPRFDLTDKTALIISLHTDGERSTIYVGKAKDHASQFVRLPNDPAVYLVSNTIDSGPEPGRWRFKRVLHYAPETLDTIVYECGQHSLHLRRDAATGALAPRDVPEGQAPADLGKFAEYFHDLSVSDYVPRDQAPRAETLVTHSLHFTDGSSATLRFLKKDEESNQPAFLDIVFDGTEPTDEKLRYAGELSARYVFSLPWIDQSKYQKECTEFFTEATALPDAEAGGETLMQ